MGSSHSFVPDPADAMRSSLPYISVIIDEAHPSFVLRVAMFSECFRPLVNGIVIALESICGELSFAGHQVICVTPEFPGSDGSNVSGAGAHLSLASLPLPTASGYRLIIPRGVVRLAGELVGTQVVHSHSMFVAGSIARRVARLLGVPFVLTYHTQLEAYAHYAPGLRGVTRMLLRRRTRALANAADVVCVPTDAVRRSLRDIGVTAVCEVLPSGVETAAFAEPVDRDALRSALRIDAGTRVVLSVARLTKEKNLEPTVEALACSDERTMLVIAGEGPLRAALVRLARARGVASRLRLPGMLDRVRLMQWYRASDVFLSTSVSETQGLVYAEALAAGLPVVAIDTPVAREVLADTDASFVSRDAAVIARAIAEAAAADTQRRQAERRVHAARFDRSRTTAALTDVYRRVIAAHAAGRDA